MKYSAQEIANILGGTIEGDASVSVSYVAKIEEGKEGGLCFLSNTKYTHFIYSSDASVVIVNNDLVLEKEVSPTLIRVEDAYSSFSKLLDLYNTINSKKPLLSEKAHISENVNIGKNCHIAPFVFIGKNSTIGDNVVLYPHCFIGDNVEIKDNSTLFSGVKIYDNITIGKENIIHSGSVIGSDGFGFAPNSEGEFTKIQQIGNVVTHENVEIGSNTTIDRATMGSTIIHKGAKLDNQIQIGHNVVIGENTVIAGLVGIAGSTKIGKNCLIGGSTGIAGHLRIGNNVRVAGHTGVGSNIKDGETIQGPYAFNQKDFLRSYIIFKRLPQMYETLQNIKKSLGN